MDSPQIPSVPNAPSRHHWDQDVVYAIMADPIRRNLLLALARRGPQTAAHLNMGVGRSLDVTLKHLKVLREAGFIIQMPNPADGRRMLYALAPAVAVKETEEGAALHFGFCIVLL